MAVTRMGHLCRVQLKELLRTPIFYAYLCLFFVYYHHLSESTVWLQQEAGLWVNAWGYAAGVFSNDQSTLVFGLGAVMIFSDLPLIREHALFESTRCSRNVWVGGRILYVLFVSVIYTLYMLLLCALTSRGKLTEPTAWGKLLNTIANGYSFDGYHVPVDLSLPVINAFTPLQAFGMTALMSVLACSVMGLVMLCLSLCVGRIAALSGVSLLAVLDFLISEKLPFWCYRFSPFSLTRLSIIYCPDMPYYPTWVEGIVTLLAANVLCGALALVLSHRHKHFADEILKEQY